MKTHTNTIWNMDLPPGAKLVYLALYWRQGREGCYPSQTEIARMTGLSERAVRDWIKYLKKRGLLDVERLRHATNPRHQVNRYTLHPGRVAETVAALTGLMTEKPDRTPAESAGVTPAEFAGNTGRKASGTPAESAGNSYLIEQSIGTPAESAGNQPENRPYLTRKKELELARLAFERKRSGLRHEKTPDRTGSPIANP